jgi:predicted ATPase
MDAPGRARTLQRQIAAGHAHTLPAYRLPLIGRENELDLLAPLIAGADNHLVTLTGAGGCGKTSLGLELAYRISGDFADGVFLVQLAALTDTALVPQAVATALGVPDKLDRHLVDALVTALCDRSTLLVLDNCEHLIDACASLANLLLQQCSGLRILATSREGHRVPGELTWRVPPLPVPDPEHLPPTEELAECPSVQLFVTRVQSGRPDFTLADSNAEAVATVCARLDGLPLALELAAARARTLPVGEVLARLDDSFRLLVGGSRRAATASW